MATLQQQLAFIRMAIYQAFHTSERSCNQEFSIHSTHGYYGTIVPLEDDAFEYSRMLKSVRRLDPLRQNWIIFAYTDTDTPAVDEAAISHAWEAIRPCIHDYECLRLKKRMQIQLLSHIACFVFRNRVNTNHEGISIAALCRELNISRGNFQRDFADYWNTIMKQLGYLDTETLMTIHHESFLDNADNADGFR